MKEAVLKLLLLLFAVIMILSLIGMAFGPFGYETLQRYAFRCGGRLFPCWGLQWPSVSGMQNRAIARDDFVKKGLLAGGIMAVDVSGTEKPLPMVDSFSSCSKYYRSTVSFA